MHNKFESNPRPYRDDIDGLRAVAVLSVVLFHIKRSFLPGGYLGVDIFFVLSGYLITGIIWHEVRSGSFSIVKFYERRIRRIAPALLGLLIFTTAISALLLLPLDLIGYSKSVFSTFTFVANIYFWRDSDYFSRAAEEKPLLHMWSLGVEEQFYILFPLLIAFLGGKLPRIASIVVAGLSIVSLLLNFFADRFGAATPAFYLLPTRAWELGAGGVLALSPLKIYGSPGVANGLGLVGLLMIVVGIICPGNFLGSSVPAAALVVFGTVFVISGGTVTQLRPLHARLLSLRPIVFIGLISYSLYLWHWPVVVFPKYYLARDLTGFESVLAFALMLLAAYASYIWIEQPFRRQSMSIATVVRWTGGGALVIASLAGALILGHGFPSRLNAAATQMNGAVGSHYRCGVSDYLALGYSRACVMELPSRNPADADLVLAGNSHAQMYAPLVGDILHDHGLHGLLVNANSCLPSGLLNTSSDCLRSADAYLNEIARLQKAKVVVFAFNWEIQNQHYLNEHGRPASLDGAQAVIAGMDDSIARMRRAGKTVILIGPLMEPGWDVASVTSRNLAFGRQIDRPLYADKDQFDKEMGPFIRAFFNRSDVIFVRPDQIQCASGRCDYVRDGTSLFSDSNHLSAQALGLFRSEFEAAIKTSLAVHAEHVN